MSDGAKIVDLGAITVNWGGHDFSGFGQNQAFSIEPTSDRFTWVEGVDGSAARAATKSRLYTVKITLLQTSASNAFCSAIHEIDQVDSSGVAGSLPFIVKDANGTDLFFSPAMSVFKEPPMTRGNKVEDQEWEFRAPDGKLYLGGSKLIGLLP